ncbi:MAG: DUF3034 family protein [Blastomonas fulva]|jgi:hypothetical protein|uniref:DUF3034 domain-containing protein n=2 Tax=Blastomonas TaxID=150203 RepID=A0ABN5B7G4_9SPHN|nr:MULTISPECIES: DUF3034 family protein [Blastomonas]AOG01897.1 hypothetical protein BSY18_1338 [Blastomonas sp. RAC04]ASR52786.1 hypothetical protein B5J99_16065 [Blastomonas fulva]
MNVHPALRTLACLIGLAALSNLPAHAQDLRNGGKLLLTNGVSTIEGSGGGGLATWSTIAGNATQEGIGGSAHGTIIELPDYNWTSYGVSLGFFDRLELSYARQNLDTIDIGTALGLGRGYTLNQDVFGAKLKLAGDVVYGDPLMPQIAIGVQHKRSSDDAVVAAVGAASPHGTDFYISATKLFLSHSLLANATVRFTKANQAGLLGFGSATQNNHKPQFEGSIAYQFSRRFVVGGEYRTKPDNLAIAREDDWVDLFAAYALTRNVTVTAAYVDLGSVATAEKQRGAFLSLQAAF